MKFYVVIHKKIIPIFHWIYWNTLSCVFYRSRFGLEQNKTLPLNRFKNYLRTENTCRSVDHTTKCSNFLLQRMYWSVVNYCINMRRFVTNDNCKSIIQSGNVEFLNNNWNVFCFISVVNLIIGCMEFIKYSRISSCREQTNISSTYLYQ